MKCVSDDMFSGIWNANVASGNYAINIVASTGEGSKVFSKVIVIEVRGSTSKFKNSG